ncbi:MAG: DUF4403 family protein [Chitinophagaceae bacterium]|nr:MAG: DUF4403 family protein [Chitinophagaceae bacterium]
MGLCLKPKALSLYKKKIIETLHIEYETEKKDNDILLKSKSIDLLTKQTQLQKTQLQKNFNTGSYQIAGSKAACAFGKQVSPWISGSCGFGAEPLRKVDVNISSQLQLLSGYQVITKTSLDKLVPRDKCIVSILQTDMTTEIMDSIRSSVETYADNFDQFVQTLNNNEILSEWRSKGNRVVPVSKYGFLNLNPGMLRMGKFNYIRDSLMFSVGFDGNPEFSSDSISIVNKSYLPPLSNTESGPGISTYLNTVYSYSSLSAILNDSLQNKPFEVEGHTFVIRQVAISGTDEGKVAVDLRFDGYKKGTLHLTGTPVLDSAKQVLSMPDISFSVDSKDMLVNMAKGLFRKRIIKQLKDQSVLDLAALIEKNKSDIEKRMNQPLNDWLRTVGKFNEFRIVGLLSKKETIQIQVYVRGDITVIGSPPAARFGF